MTDESDEADAASREPTLLLDEVVMLADAIRAETRQVSIHVSERRAGRDHLGRLARVLSESPGACPVQLFIRFEDGNEAVLALPKYRVEPSDGMLARLEKLFGEKVAELR
jgi:DNA polymerase-3 subunit alpha